MVLDISFTSLVDKERMQDNSTQAVRMKNAVTTSRLITTGTKFKRLKKFIKVKWLK